MPFTFREATLADLDTLTALRVETLRAANKLANNVDMDEVERASRLYYTQYLGTPAHIAYLVYDSADAQTARLIGCGDVCFYEVMPTYQNPSGQKAYVMNMYTRPPWRRQGAASQTLALLVRRAHERGVAHIALEATDEGRLLYQKHGFLPMKYEMQHLPTRNEGSI